MFIVKILFFHFPPFLTFRLLLCARGVLCMKAVFNVDDVGYCGARNEGARLAQAAGVCLSGTVLVTGAAASEAAACRLVLGLHFNLTEGQPVAPATAISTLCVNGRFVGKYAFFLRLASGLVALSDVRRELLAQLARFVMLYGCAPSHLDGHNHVHVAPGVCEVVAEVLALQGIRAVRVPLEDSCSHVGEPLSPFLHNIATHAATAAPVFHRAGLRSPAAFVGLRLMGQCLTVGALVSELLRLRNLGVRSCEVMTHPSLAHGTEGLMPCSCR